MLLAPVVCGFQLKGYKKIHTTGYEAQIPFFPFGFSQWIKTIMEDYQTKPPKTVKK